MMDDDLENHQSDVLGDHGGELLPKLKMKIQELVGMDQDQNQSHHHGASICQFCNKGFRSNKALGGHLRIHYQSHPELIKKSTQPTKKRKREDIVVTLADIAKKLNTSKRNKVIGSVPRCFVCSKTFPSMKSLFGHMRCHPRDWKGIHPPPAIDKTTTSYSSTSSSSMVLSDVELQHQYNNNNNNKNDRVSNFSAAPVDLTESLFGWSATAKRGRKQQSQTSLDFEREILAAHELIRLAHGDGVDLFHESRSSPTPIPNLTPTSMQTVVVEATNSNSLAYKAEDKKKKRSFQDLSAGYIKEGHHHPVKQLSFRPVDDRKHENKAAQDDDDDDDDDETGKSISSQSKWEGTNNWVYEEDESASRNTEQQLNGNGKVIIVKNNIKKKRKKIKDLDSVQDASPDPVHVHQVMPATTTTTPDKYRCGTCDKSFQTHQALGGHRSVHNKLIKTTIHNFVVEEEEEEEGLADSLMFEEEENKESEEGAGSSKQVDDETTTTTTTIHKCSRKFSAGHALVAAVAPSSQEVSASVGELSHTCGGGGRVLDFDLNEAPPVEEEDDDVAAGCLKCEERDVCGHASSSFNSVEFPVFESSSSGP